MTTILRNYFPQNKLNKFSEAYNEGTSRPNRLQA